MDGDSEATAACGLGVVIFGLAATGIFESGAAMEASERTEELAAAEAWVETISRELTNKEIDQTWMLHGRGKRR